MEWRHFECSTEECGYRYVAPFKIGAHREASGPLDFCPLCEEYLPFTGIHYQAVVVAEESSEQYAQVVMTERGEP
jgi:hypothetical protein